MPPLFQADENLNAKIISGLLRREPSLNFQTAKAGKLLGLTDPEVLGSARGANPRFAETRPPGGDRLDHPDRAASSASG
jgi:hypothetical protein